MLDILHSFSGVLANVLTVVVGSVLGLVLKRQIPEKLTDAVMTAIGLCTIAIGIMGIIKGENQLVMIISMVLGAVVGTLVDIDGRLQKIGDKLQKKSKQIYRKKTLKAEKNYQKGFIRDFAITKNNLTFRRKYEDEESGNRIRHFGSSTICN